MKHYYRTVTFARSSADMLSSNLSARALNVADLSLPWNSMCDKTSISSSFNLNSSALQSRELKRVEFTSVCSLFLVDFFCLCFFSLVEGAGAFDSSLLPPFECFFLLFGELSFGGI